MENAYEIDEVQSKWRRRKIGPHCWTAEVSGVQAIKPIVDWLRWGKAETSYLESSYWWVTDYQGTLC